MERPTNGKYSSGFQLSAKVSRWVGFNLVDAIDLSITGVIETGEITRLIIGVSGRMG